MTLQHKIIVSNGNKSRPRNHNNCKTEMKSKRIYNSTTLVEINFKKIVRVRVKYQAQHNRSESKLFFKLTGRERQTCCPGRKQVGLIKEPVRWKRFRQAEKHFKGSESVTEKVHAIQKCRQRVWARNRLGQLRVSRRGIKPWGVLHVTEYSLVLSQTQTGAYIPLRLVGATVGKKWHNTTFEANNMNVPVTRVCNTAVKWQKHGCQKITFNYKFTNSIVKYRLTKFTYPQVYKSSLTYNF